MSKIEILSESDPMTLDQCKNENDILTKEGLKNKWNEFKKGDANLKLEKA